MIAEESSSEEMRLWDTATRKVIWKLEKNERGVDTPLAFSLDGNILATESGHRVRLWDVATGERIVEFPGYDEEDLYQATFSSDGKMLAVARTSAPLLIWDAGIHAAVCDIISGEETEFKPK